MSYFPLILAIAFVFFLVIPGVGAFGIRARWRRFRHALFDSLNAPLYKPGILPSSDHSGVEKYRCIGTLESVQDNDRLWIQSGQQSISVDVARATVYIVPGIDDGLVGDYGVRVQALPWARAGILTQGIGIFVYGSLSMNAGMPHFSGSGTPLILLFEGKPDFLLSRSLWYGRQRNEYWNDFTPVSLLAGAGILLALSFFLFGEEYFIEDAIRAASFALLPFIALMPPGVLAFFMYRRWWRHSRFLRARKDLISLGIRLHGSECIRKEASYKAEHLPEPLYVSDRRKESGPIAQGECIVLPEDKKQSGKGRVIRYHGNHSADPFAECLIVEGVASERVARDLIKARLYEYASVAMMGIALATNWYLTLYVIVLVVTNV